MKIRTEKTAVPAVEASQPPLFVAKPFSPIAMYATLGLIMVLNILAFLICIPVMLVRYALRGRE